MNLATLLVLAIALLPDDPSWPQWRGPLMTGVAPDADPPIEWSESKNIRWKVELPGRGHSTPVVWNDRIYLTASMPIGEKVEPIPETAPGAHHNVLVPYHHRFMVLAVDRKNGAILWNTAVHEELPHEGGHESGTLASGSPATDGKVVIAFFGSRGLYALDPDGTLLWKKDLGRMYSKHAHGEGSSPLLHGDTVVVIWDHERDSFVAAFDRMSGEERWRTTRDEKTSWASPIVVEHDGVDQLIVSGTTRIRAYDLSDGSVIWECGGLSKNVVATPVSADGIVVAGSSYDTRAILAIRLDGAAGDLTGTDQVLWRRIRGTPYVPSPLLYDDSVYFLNHYQGVLSKADLKTGENQAGPFRLSGLTDIYASPVGAGGRIYITDRDGTTLVMSHEDQPKILSLNRLDDSISASAAPVGRELILRGEQYLYCIAEP